MLFFYRFNLQLVEIIIIYRKNKQMPRPWAVNLADNKLKWQGLSGKYSFFEFKTALK